MVPGGLDGEWQLLRTGLRQGARRYPQERLVSGRLTAVIASAEGPQMRARHFQAIGSEEQMFGEK